MQQCQVRSRGGVAIGCKNDANVTMRLSEIGIIIVIIIIGLIIIIVIIITTTTTTTTTTKMQR